MHRLRLDLLRSPTLHVGSQPHALSRKDAALLSVLALERGFSRDRLAAWLWPDQAPTRALNNLRQRRFRLARLAGARVIEGQGTLALSAGVEHDLVDDFERFAALPTPWHGELLDGCEYDDEPELDDWLRARRQQFRARRADWLSRLVDHCERDGDLDAAVMHAARLCAHEPLAEPAHRRLMRLHVRRGDPASALQAYRGLAERLDAELGEWPGQETSDLAASIKLGESTRATTPRGLPDALLRPPRLVGRDGDWRRLALARESGRAVLLRGAPGIGKSRLLADFAASVGRAVRVAARVGDRDRPYALLARLLERLRSEAAVAPVLERWAVRELAVIAPRSAGSGRRVDPLRLEHAFAHAIAVAEVDAIALDDLQQADAASLELLPKLATAQSGGPAWLFATRDREVPDVLDTWARASDGPVAVDLAPLDTAGVGALLESLDLPGVVGEEWSGALWRHAGGNPLFLLETLRGVMSQSHPLEPPRPGRGLPAPALARQILAGRLADLPPGARPLAQAAAVTAAPMTLDFAAELLESTPLALATDWAALERAQLVAAGGLVHDLVRDAILADTPAVVAQWLHARAAATLERRDASPGLVAAHWRDAGRFEAAADAYRAAAARAWRAARPQDELRLIDQAIECLERAGADDRALALRLESLEVRQLVADGEALIDYTRSLLDAAQAPGPVRIGANAAHAESLLLAGRVDEAQPFCAAAAVDGRDASATPHDRLVAGRVAAIALSIRARVDEALALLEAAAPRDADEQLLERDRQVAWATRAFVLHRAGRLSDCAEAIEHALRMAESDLASHDVLPQLANLMGLQVNLGRVEAAVATLARASALRERLGEMRGTQAAHFDLQSGLVLLAGGRPASALAAFERARRVFDVERSLAWRHGAENWVASAWLRIGHAGRAGAAMTPADGPSMGMFTARRAVLELRIARMLGQPCEGALAACLATLDRADATMTATIDIERALESSDLDEALERLARVRDETQQREQFGIATRARFAAVDLCLRAGAADRAAVEAGAALRAQRITRASDVDIAPAIRRALGADRDGDPALHDALRAQADAIDAATLADLPPELLPIWRTRSEARRDR